MKNYDKSKESSFLVYLDVNKLYGWAMSQKQPADRFVWVKDVCKIDEEFIKNYDNDDDIGYILKVDIEYPKKLYEKKRKLISVKNLYVHCMIKNPCYPHKKLKTSIRAWFKTKKST